MIDPAPDRLPAHFDASLRHQFFDVTTAQREPEIQPDRISNDIWREPISFERQGFSHHGLRMGLQAQSGDNLALDCQHPRCLSARLNSHSAIRIRLHTAIAQRLARPER